MSRARLGLILIFMLWSLLLFGGSGAIGWIGSGLAQLLAQIHLGWLGSIAAGLGKLLLFFIWFASAGVFALLFAATGQLGRAVQEAMRNQRPQAAPDEVVDATVTLERDDIILQHILSL
jgi:hypothetical protein